MFRIKSLNLDQGIKKQIEQNLFKKNLKKLKFIKNIFNNEKFAQELA